MGLLWMRSQEICELWPTVPSAVVLIHYYTFTGDLLLTFMPNKQWRKFMQRKDYYEWWHICVQHLFSSKQFVTSKVYS